MPRERSVCVHVQVLQSCPTLSTPWTFVAHQAPLSMGFSRKEYWSGLLCPPPGDLPDPGIKPTTFFNTNAIWQAQREKIQF